jgi:Domain of unknown function (DUF6647)
MKIIARSVRAALITATIVAAATSVAAAANPTPDLVESLRRWLDANSEYPRRAVLPEIRLVPRGDPALLDGSGGLSKGRLRGVYDDQTATVYLVEPWSTEAVFDISVLLHELVHHRQTTAKHWYCPQEQEWRAYQIQAQWLEEHGIEPKFYWPAIALESSCARRDIHPD